MNTSPLAALALVAALSTSTLAHGDELKTPAERDADRPTYLDFPSERPPPLESLRLRPPLIEEEYQRKKEHNYFTGLPLANSDPNTGFGFGARVYYFRNGDRSDPRFAYTPYLHRIFLQAFFSTQGLQFHWLDYDAPAFQSSSYRLRASAILARNTSENYFHRDGRSLKALTFTGAGRTFERAPDMDEALAKVGPDGKTRALYNKLDLMRPQLAFSLEKSLWGGLLRPFVGLGFSQNMIRDYTGKMVRAIDPITGEETRAPMAPTRFREDCDAGKIVGCSGGWENYLRLAVVLDTRDFEPDPNNGIMAEISGELGTRALGSQYEFARVLGVVRGYWSPLQHYADLVLAGRALYQVQTQGTPFFSMNVFPFSEDFRLGLGGVRTLRGYRQDRFVGHVMALTNLEVRWTIGHFPTLNQDFAFIVVPFVDLGRTFERVSQTSFAEWKQGQGAALRIAWNQATLIMVDYGVSSEDTGLYINFNHIF
ncbi:MAG: DUF5982 domain-containing protein [Myxococcales bacterium]|nr:DUF5982 domain-containing protein [Polyangiaceae bacterium]MDW8251902.1 DUF5982 domain-containing protein [Myxococcales bacterium]